MGIFTEDYDFGLFERLIHWIFTVGAHKMMGVTWFWVKTQ